MKILMTGATGLVGQRLGLALSRAGYQIYVISRQRQVDLPFPFTLVTGDLNEGPLPQLKQEDFHAVINLLGETVAQRWNEEIKSRIYNSRVKATANLIASLGKVEKFISASAIGYYGDRGEELLIESSAPGSDFLSQVCVDWEKQLETLSSETRCVCLRLGVVLSEAGGALEKMLPPFLMGVGGPIGHGKHYMSWIHIDDLVAMFIWALQNPSVTGAINAVSPGSVSNKEFSANLAKVLGRPALLPTPLTALQLLFGEMAQILTCSQKVSAEKSLSQGFKFKFSNLQAALIDLLGHYQRGETRFQAEQYFPNVKIEDIFSFFSSETNLEAITPKSLSFKVLGKTTAQIQQGTQITYRLKIHGVPAKWVTLIEDWLPPRKFVDTQLQGPYSKWHHTHEFEQLQGGVLMRDLVYYKEPLGWLGQLVAGRFIANDVKQIFNHRKQTLKDHDFKS